MERVERQNEPRRWTHWAASRQDLGAYSRRAVEILEPLADNAVECEIRVPGYEREFTGPDHFLAHVDEAEWQGLRRIEVTLRVRTEPQWLHAWLQVVGPPFGSVLLLIQGGTRHDRNAVEPDLVEAVGRFATSKARARQRLAILAILAGLAFFVVQAGVGQGVEALGASAFLASMVGAATIALLVFYLTMEKLGHVLWLAGAGTEFLPDDRRSVWERFRQSLTAKVLVASTLLAAIAGVITVILTLAD